MLPTRLSAIAALLMTLASSPTWAQTSLNAQISRGVALRRQGRDAAALEVFQSAWRSSRAPRALAQVALAEQALGRWVAAEAHLVEALAAARDPWVRSRLAILQSALAEIRRHVGRLDVVGEPSGAEVVLDGAVVGQLPLSTMLRVPTGSLTFTVRSEGYFPVTRTVQVDGRYPLREPVRLASVTARVAAPELVAPPSEPERALPLERAALPQRTTPRTPALRYAGYALIGTGAAALAVSGVFLGINLIASGEASSATPSSADPYGAWARFQGEREQRPAEDGQRAVRPRAAPGGRRRGAGARPLRSHLHLRHHLPGLGHRGRRARADRRGVRGRGPLFEPD
nr:PEGA domain-containing protein [Deltaproteobacteria bacterium]